jgi:hypothetical protein
MLENSTAVLHDARSKTTGNQHAQVIGSSLVGLPNIKNQSVGSVGGQAESRIAMINCPRVQRRDYA